MSEIFFPDFTSARSTDRAAKKVVSNTSTLLGALHKHERHTRKLYKKARNKNIEIYLNRLPLYALREVGATNVRTSVLEKAGVRTVGDILSRGPRRLQNIQGVGPHSAKTAYNAAKKIRRIAEKVLSVRLDDDVRPKAEEKLLQSLMHVRETHVILGGIKREAEEVQKELTVLAKKSRPAARWWHRPFLSKQRKIEVAKAYQITQNYLAVMSRSGLDEALVVSAKKVHKAKKIPSETLWGSYHNEPETFDTLLREVVGFIPQDGDKLPLGREPERGPGPRDGITTVYRMYDHKNVLLYVGISNRVDLRIEQHRASKDWFWRVDRIKTEEYPNRATALNVEEKAIKSERPKYNIIHNTR
jgi:predicted GIY-YIG superfamily endonuclease/predicted transcriptional regulator